MRKLICYSSKGQSRLFPWIMVLVHSVGSMEATVLFEEDFRYPDGPLTSQIGSPWITQGGTASQVNVIGGSVELTEKETEDVSAGLIPNPVQDGTLYFGFTLTVQEPPRGEGNYFMHLRDAGSAQKARIWISSDAIRSGFYKIGIANGTGAPMYLSGTLQLGERYRVVVQHKVSTPTQSMLWVDPVNEDDGDRILATDNNTRLNSIYGLSLRQALTSGDGIGRVLIDEIRIGTKFTEALGLPASPKLSIVRDDGFVRLSWKGPEDYLVQQALALPPASWETIPVIPESIGDLQEVLMPMEFVRAFYRLLKP